MSLGQRELSVIKRCPYYRERNCMNFGVLGQRELSVIKRCPYYREKNCMNFGVFGTEKCLYYRGDCKELFDCTFFIL